MIGKDRKYFEDTSSRYDETFASGEEESKETPKKEEKTREALIASGISNLGSLLFVIIFTLFLIIQSIYITDDTENAVITTFGNPTVVQNAGPHFKIPLIQKVEKVDMTSRGMAIGYTAENDETIAEESMMITKDFNFLDVYFHLQYEVSDPIKFLYNSEQPELILSNLAQSSIRDTVGSYGVDDVLTTSREEIQEKVKETLVKSLEKADIGIKINNVTIQDVEPPTAEIQNAFDSVETAKQNAEGEINNAKKYKEEQIPNAEAEADKVIQNANAEKTARINEANGQVARFNALYAQYKNAPEVTKLRMYYEVMEEVMPNVKVVILDSNGTVVSVFEQPYDSSNTKTENTTQATTGQGG